MAGKEHLRRRLLAGLLPPPPSVAGQAEGTKAEQSHARRFRGATNPPSCRSSEADDPIGLRRVGDPFLVYGVVSWGNQRAWLLRGSVICRIHVRAWIVSVPTAWV